MIHHLVRVIAVVGKDGDAAVRESVSVRSSSSAALREQMVTFIDKMQENGADTEAEIVEKYMEAAEQEGVTLTRDEVLDELAADFAGDMLDDADHPLSTILADAQPVYVGKDLPGEYKSSEYTKTMKSALRKIKMQAATNLDEMLLLAENGEWRENVKPKHSKDAQNGWYRYDTQFAVPILNAKKAIDHYTVYGGALLIRNDADGKSYLYGLLDVEKKKVISKTSFSAETHSEVTSPKPSDTRDTHRWRECQATVFTESLFGGGEKRPCKICKGVFRGDEQLERNRIHYHGRHEAGLRRPT